MTGTLEQVMGMGGESTGWAIKLDADLEVAEGARKVKQIEIDPNGKTIEALEGKRVQVTGSLVWRHGVERGVYQVIMVDTIKEYKKLL